MVKWDPVTDQILLLKILETSQVNADVKAIAEAWPDTLDKPTPRAITERLVKIRAQVKSNGVSAHFSVSSSKGNISNAGTPNKASTPRKPKNAATGAGVIKNVSPKKGGARAGEKGRGKGEKSVDGEGDDFSADDNSVTIKPEIGAGAGADADDGPDELTPSKNGRAKAGAEVKVEKDEGQGHQGAGFDDGEEYVDAADYAIDDILGYDGAVFA